jgi:ubiquinone/menaquinone biosynthesis C-methylase UbiE
MNDYYTGWRARYYNLFWRTYTRRTLQAAETMIDLQALLVVPERAEASSTSLTCIADTAGRPPDSPRNRFAQHVDAIASRTRPLLLTTKHIVVLDVACGTGALLGWLLEHIPAQHTAELDAYGIDASQDMLAQASAALQQWPNVHLQQLELATGQTAGLPYQPQTFDLITCTNALHYLPDPVGTLAGLAQLLAPAGQLVLQDYRERDLSFVTSVFKWLVRRVDPRYVRTYTLAEASSLCRRAGLCVVCEKMFRIDLLCDGWALRASSL